MGDKSIPLMGALQGNTDTPEVVALQMVMKRLQAFEQQQAMLVQHITQTTEATQEQLTYMQQQMQADMKKQKEDAERGIAALKEQFVKLVEGKQLDPQAREEVRTKTLKEAKQELQRIEGTFKESLQTMPRGEIRSLEPTDVHLIINGVPFVVKPGLNHDVPMAYVEEWGLRDRHKKWAASLDRAFQNDGGQGLSVNQVEAIRGGHGPVWSEEQGRIG